MGAIDITIPGEPVEVTVVGAVFNVKVLLDPLPDERLEEFKGESGVRSAVEARTMSPAYLAAVRAAAREVCKKVVELRAKKKVSEPPQEEEATEEQESGEEEQEVLAAEDESRDEPMTIHGKSPDKLTPKQQKELLSGRMGLIATDPVFALNVVNAARDLSIIGLERIAEHETKN